MEAIPLEILHHIMGFSKDADIRRIALVSRGFRSAAISHKHFFIAWIRRPMFIGAREVSAICERLDHVLELQLPFAVEWRPPWVSVPDTDWRGIMEPMFGRINQGFHLVVKLLVVIPSDCRDMLEHILHSPAPRLRELKISTKNNYNKNSIMEDPFPLPLDLFQGYAPRLASLTTTAMSLATAAGPYPGPVTAGIKTLRVDVHMLSSLIVLSCHFPMVEFITLIFNDNRQPLNIDLGGLSRLALLKLENLQSSTASSWFPSRTDISYIPEVLWKCADKHDIFYHKWMWVGVTGRISMYTFEGENYPATVSVTGSQGGIRRLYCSPYMQLNDTLLISNVGNIFAENLTDVRTWGSYLSQWLGMDNVRFPVLERLHIDVLNDQDFEVLELLASPITCNKLRVVVVEPLDRDYIISNVLATDIAKIGRNLGQTDRVPGERASLETFRIAFEDDPVVLNSVFSSTLFDANSQGLSSYGKPLAASYWWS